MSSEPASLITVERTNIIDATQWFCLHSCETYESYYGWHCTRCDALLCPYGCASQPKSYAADERAIEKFERTVKQCERQGKTLIAKRTGSRIRREYSREDLLRAQCSI